MESDTTVLTRRACSYEFFAHSWRADGLACVLGCCNETPRSVSRPSSACGSSIRTLIRVGDYDIDVVAEKTDRRTRARPSHGATLISWTF